ncbi:MAG: hypothetical protein FJW96_14190 [Actinobacteria bacterium]|nr:hypothetical protein [Actinomycetota bacterium]
MAIGQELLDVPFADLVRNLAFAIAEGQLALDRSSIETLRYLMTNQVDVVPEITEVIEPVGREVKVGDKTVPYSGASIVASGAKPVAMSLLQAGIQPTFYQFTEATIEVKVSIAIKQTDERGTESPTEVPLKGYRLRAFASPVNYRSANTYSYDAAGSSTFRATLRPVPPPPRLTPRTVTVNALVSPPTVTITD